MDKEEEEKANLFMTKEQATEALGKEMTVEAVLNLAKDGEAFRKEVIEDAVTAGVRAMGTTSLPTHGKALSPRCLFRQYGILQRLFMHRQRQRYPQDEPPSRPQS